MPCPIKLLILPLLLTLAACATTKQVKVPEVQLVEVLKYIPVPSELTKDCHIEESGAPTVEELVRVANARKTSLANCNVDKQKIRTLKEP